MNQADFRVSAEAQEEVHSSLGICSVKFSDGVLGLSVFIGFD